MQIVLLCDFYYILLYIYEFNVLIYMFKKFNMYKCMNLNFQNIFKINVYNFRLFYLIFLLFFEYR